MHGCVFVMSLVGCLLGDAFRSYVLEHSITSKKSDRNSCICTFISSYTSQIFQIMVFTPFSGCSPLTFPSKPPPEEAVLVCFLRMLQPLCEEFHGVVIRFFLDGLFMPIRRITPDGKPVNSKRRPDQHISGRLYGGL